MIRFIFGDAGAGKSTYIYQEICRRSDQEPHRSFFLFVPEQNTLKAQREMIRTSARHGMLHTDVLSFQLLAYRVMEELGISKPLILDDLSKAILIRRAAMENAGELRVYNKKLDSEGFIAQLRMLFSELSQYGVSEEMLANAENAAREPLLQAKLADIRCIYQSYRRNLSDRVTVPEEIPAILKKHIARSEMLKDAVLYFDGYTGFTPVQLQLLEFILPMCREAVFSVAIPGNAEPYRHSSSPAAITDLYWLSRETVYKVCRAAEKNNVGRGQDVVIPDRSGPDDCREVEIYEAEDPTDEVRYAARTIRRMAMQEGVRYQRMAVAVSEMASYREILRREMTEEGIPFFMDDKTGAVGNPVTECIRSALKCITEGYSYEQAAYYLKNPLLGTDVERRGRIDRLDNRMLARGLRGRKALEQAEEEAQEEAAAAGKAAASEKAASSEKAAVAENTSTVENSAAAGLGLTPLFHLHDQLREARTVVAKAEAVRRFMEELDLQKLAADLGARLEELGLAREAGETVRFVDLTGVLLDRLTEVLGEETISMKDFVRLMEAGFGDMKAGVIPEKMDMLLVGDLKRSRFDNIDILFIIGANEGLLPSTVTGGGIFTDREREDLESLSLELAPDDKTDSCIQQFYLYSLMHKPCRRLIFTCAAQGRDQSVRRPAEVILDLKDGRYPGFVVKAGLNAGAVVSPADALQQLAEIAAAEDTSYLRELARQLLRNDETKEAAGKILRAAFRRYGGDRLSREAAKRLYEEKLYGSVTRLESYERCPFQHFLRYGLRLKEREEFDVEAMDIGNLFHQSLDMIFRRAREEGQQLQDLSDNRLRLITAECVEQVTGSYHDDLMQFSAKNRYIAEQVRRVTERTVWALKRQLAGNEFRTAGTEVPFRHQDGALDLHGVIDRVDISDDGAKANTKTKADLNTKANINTEASAFSSVDPDGQLRLPLEMPGEPAPDRKPELPAEIGLEKVYVRIVDYKSGSTRFDISLAVNGLQMQLVTYMDMALEKIGNGLGKGQEAAPAGMYYYNINDPVVGYKQLQKGQSPEELILEQLKMNGAAALEAGTAGKDEDNVKSASCVMSEEQFRKLMTMNRERMKKDADSILEGDIRIAPFRGGGRSGCDFCEYRSICGFEEGLEGFGYRRIRKKGLEDLDSHAVE